MLRLSAAALGAVLCTFAPTLVTAQSAGAKPAADAASDALRLRELFGVTHPLQLVEFEAGGQKLAQPAGVLKSKQQATPYQQLANGKVVLLTGLPANSACEWQLATAAAAPDGAIPNPVVVTKDGKTYRIENGLTGVAIPAEGSAAQMAPIQGIRYRDGAWTATGPSQQEFLRLYAAAYPALYGCVVSLLPGNPDADDVFQQTSLVLWRKFTELRRGSSFLAWAC